MGVSSSQSQIYSPQNNYYHQSNKNFGFNRLKSALAINKRKNNKLIGGLVNLGHNFRNRRGVYKTLDDNQKVEYETTNIIGKGSFGIVYAARNEYGQVVAIKSKKALLDVDLMEKSTLLFRDELEALYNLNHPNILRLFGVEFRGSEAISLVTEYIVGETLDRVIRSYRNINETTIQSFTKQMVDALAYMHSQFVMHRDLKSSNIMVVGNRLIKMIDFGMAKHFDFSDSSVTDFDMASSTVVGTVPYMAPELINFGKYNSKVDIWSIGVLVYEMNNGDVFLRERRSAFGVDTVPLTQATGPVSLPTLSPIANSFIQTCLIKNADYRPPATVLLSHPFVRNVTNPALTYNPFSAMQYSQYIRQ